MMTKCCTYSPCLFLLVMSDPNNHSNINEGVEETISDAERIILNVTDALLGLVRRTPSVDNIIHVMNRFQPAGTSSHVPQSQRSTQVPPPMTVIVPTSKQSPSSVKDGLPGQRPSVPQRTNKHTDYNSTIQLQEEEEDEIGRSIYLNSSFAKSVDAKSTTSQSHKTKSFSGDELDGIGGQANIKPLLDLKQKEEDELDHLPAKTDIEVVKPVSSKHPSTKSFPGGKFDALVENIQSSIQQELCAKQLRR